MGIAGSRGAEVASRKRAGRKRRCGSGREVVVEPESLPRHYTVQAPARSHPRPCSGPGRKNAGAQHGAGGGRIRCRRRLCRRGGRAPGGAPVLFAREVRAQVPRRMRSRAGRGAQHRGGGGVGGYPQRPFPGRRIVLVTGMVAGHDPARFYEPLAHLIDTAHVAPIQFHRALPPSDVALELRDQVPGRHDSRFGGGGVGGSPIRRDRARSSW